MKELDNSLFLSIAISALSESARRLSTNTPVVGENIWFRNIKKSGNKITVSPNKLTKLSTYFKKNGVFTYGKVLRFIICMGLQLTALTKNNCGFIHITMDDIVVIDDDWFLITNFDNISLLTKDGKINITTPFSANKFTAPELRDIKTLPIDVEQTCSYYSIAIICLSLFGFEYNKDNMDKLYPSPVYFFIERCLYEEPEKRAFLLI